MEKKLRNPLGMVDIQGFVGQSGRLEGQVNNGESDGSVES